MDEHQPVARPRTVRVTAACSAVLVVAATAGYALLGGALPGLPASLVSVGTPPAATPTPAPTPTARLPLRVPEASVTLTARPQPPLRTSQPTPTAAQTAAPTAGQTSAATSGGAGATAAMPSAGQRDRELAALLARTAAGAPAVTAGARSAPSTGTGAGGASSTGAATGTASGTVRDPAGSPAGETVADFRISSFNVLGSSHTRNGGRGRRPGVVRMRGAVALLARHDVDVAGFQELQHDQARELLRATGGSWALYPGPSAPDSDNSIGWRTSEFQLVRTSTLPIPYFNGRKRQMPVVLLRHRATGMTAWVANVHNPAETRRYRNQQRWRTQATHLEAGLANRLHGGGVPLLLTGDMNERSAYFCRLTAAAPAMVAARGGSNGPGGCRARAPRAVDWIFGSAGVTFSDYAEDRSDLVDVTTDHPVIVGRVRIDAATFPRAMSRAR